MNKLSIGNANLIRRAEEFLDLGVKPKNKLAKKSVIEEKLTINGCKNADNFR